MSDLDTILNETPAPAADTSTPIAPASEAPATPAPAPARMPNVAQGDTVTYLEYDDVTCESLHTRAAFVTHVWSPTCVNLTVFDPDGSTRGIASVSFGSGHRSWTGRA